MINLGNQIKTKTWEWGAGNTESNPIMKSFVGTKEFVLDPQGNGKSENFKQGNEMNQFILLKAHSNSENERGICNTYI